MFGQAYDTDSLMQISWERGENNKINGYSWDT